MKRSIFVATLALTPALLHAQATLPAHTGSQNVLQARAAAPAAIKSAVDKNSTSTVRVSTGVVAPKLIKSVNLTAADGLHAQLLANDATVVVTMTVDASGKPSNLAIAQSANPVVDKQVLEAVSQYRYQPGTLDGVPYELPVRLQVVIQHGAK